MKQLIFFFLFTVSSLCAVSFDSMSEADKKACGIEKLSNNERELLQAWLTQQLKPTVTKPGKIAHGMFTVAEIRDLGHFVVLDNGISYDVYSRSRKKTMAWKVGDKIELVEPIRAKSFKLTNTSNKQTVSAKERL